MEGLAEWRMHDGAWIQVYEEKQRAGFSSVTFAVHGFEQQLDELKAKAIPVESTTSSDYVKTATVRSTPLRQSRRVRRTRSDQL